MKKLFFLFALLAGMTASATVTVTPLDVNYGTKTVIFKVEWTNTPSAPYNNRAWVWVDFCSINGTSPGSFAPATVTSPAITGGNGTITNATARGFFIEYGATNAGTTVTATLSNAPAGKFNWCVYGSDAPPNVTANNGTYTLYGTPPFTLTAANGTATQTVAATTIATSAVTITPVTLTDQTGCPGVFCIYSGSDLFIDTDHLCQQRTDGAKNWEAYIKDSRDNQIYRITQFSDNSWWFAVDFNINLNVMATCSNKRLYNPGNYPACPAGWRVPTISEARGRWGSTPWSDTYGGASDSKYIYYTNQCYTDRKGRHDIIATGCGTYSVWEMCGDGLNQCMDRVQGTRMRCLRQL